MKKSLGSGAWKNLYSFHCLKANYILITGTVVLGFVPVSSTEGDGNNMPFIFRKTKSPPQNSNSHLTAVLTSSLHALEKTLAEKRVCESSGLKGKTEHLSQLRLSILALLTSRTGFLPYPLSLLVWKITLGTELIAEEQTSGFPLTSQSSRSGVSQKYCTLFVLQKSTPPSWR